MLEDQGLVVERQRPLALEFDGLRFDEAHRLDLFVENQVVVELKATEALLPVHTRQLLTYLRILDLPIGLLINFGAPTLKEGLRRVLNPYASALKDAGPEKAGETPP
jgi:GxxExxY protein